MNNLKALKDLWKDAPEWANWLARSPSGWVHYYENKPTLESYGWLVNSGKGGFGVFKIMEGDWRNSLRQHPSKKNGHPHAELMSMYADDARKHEKPWELWEIKGINDQWYKLDSNPVWNPVYEYRRKPKTIMIGDIEVPEPMRETPPKGTAVWLCDAARGDLVYELVWAGLYSDILKLKRGLIHRTKEAAELHAKAIIKINGGSMVDQCER